MCGIFGVVSNNNVIASDFYFLVNHAQQRGQDSSGVVYFDDANKKYIIHRADYPVVKLMKQVKPNLGRFAMGHSRLITNGLADNQPVLKDNVCVIHNGIILNDKAIWEQINKKRELQIDTEAILGITSQCLHDGMELSEIPFEILKLCKGVVACAIVFPKMGKLCLFSNNGSLYLGDKKESQFFSSEKFPLVQIGCENILQVRIPVFIDLPSSDESFDVSDKNERTENLIPSLSFSLSEEKLLVKTHSEMLKRCSKCILPETMPFIHFDSDGVCNYCKNYKPRNKIKHKEELLGLVEPFRRKNGNDCIVPFSGGRDSSYGLHLIVNELKMKPITYTYDWGMITDLGRRNISRMCSELGVENIIVAANISKKRRYIKNNLIAWLKSPNLGMISILTAGDKHFFKYIETIKNQTGINLNLWSINPLEVTYFKSGFLGIPPDFEEKGVYSRGVLKQLKYQYLRFKAMLESPGYFNASLWDTLSGEFYRSFTKKNDYYHIFDYWQWDEKLIDDTLDCYNWEKAFDTNTTWRIGDGTAAFYNYIYYTIAGFTEHDTFRSNQIREGQISRQEALNLVNDENKPRYQNIKWYLDALGMDFKQVIETINSVPHLY